VWADEFDRTGAPDPSRWAYDTSRNKDGWWNAEAQYYADARPENARLENGSLVIEARRERLDPLAFPDWGGQGYTSARLITRDKATWTYGFFEIRARLPCGVGSWPAIWMLSAPPLEAWPDDGEIDIMEHVGHDKGAVYGTVHTGAYNHAIGTHRSVAVHLPDACDAFHRYQLTWTEDAVTIGVDDFNYYRLANDGRGDRSTWPFDGPFYLLLNLAVGGSWGGAAGIDDTIFPVRMEVDYVRVHQRPS
jgi:beta-glucanase (GH16 family)